MREPYHRVFGDFFDDSFFISAMQNQARDPPSGYNAQDFSHSLLINKSTQVSGQWIDAQDILIRNAGIPTVSRVDMTIPSTYKVGIELYSAALLAH